MAKIKTPTDREAIILQALIGNDRYGLEIRDRYEQAAGSAMPLGSLYTTLDRMESAGFLKSYMGEPTHERGGNRRKYFKITGTGMRAMDLYRDRIARARGILDWLRSAVRSVIGLGVTNA